MEYGVCMHIHLLQISFMYNLKKTKSVLLISIQIDNKSKYPLSFADYH
jgi:hypothetical protein